MRSSLVTRLKASSPPQLVLVAVGSLAIAGVGTAAAASLIIGADGPDRSLTGGDQDLSGGRVPNGGLTRPSTPTPTQPLTAAQIRSGDASARPVAAARAAAARTDPTTPSGPAPLPAGGGTSDPGGPKGSTGGAGPKGDTGDSGPTVTVNARAGNETGAPGPTGDTGSGGPVGDAPNSGGDATPPAAPKPSRTPAPATPAAVLVKDANGTTAGTLLSADPATDWLMFSYKDRAYVANSRTGALDLPKVDTSYSTDDCTGTPYSPLSRPAKSVLRSSNPSEAGIYEFGQPRSVDVRSIWQLGEGVADACLQYVYTNSELAPLRELSADERPPTLSGPLRSVSAN